MLLILSLFLPLLSCKNSTTPPQTSDNDILAEQGFSDEEPNSNTDKKPLLSEEKSAAEAALNELPDVSFGGISFIITYAQRKNATFDDTADSIVSKARFHQIQIINNKYDTDIITALAHYPSMEDGLISAKASQTVYSHLIFTDSNKIGTLTYKELIGNINALPFVDLSAPYFDHEINSAASTKTGLYGVAGDATFNADESAAVIYNKYLTSYLDIPSLEETVKEGAWTLDKMREYSKMAHGTDKKNLYVSGVCTDGKRTVTDILFVASGIKTVERDDDSAPVLLDNRDAVTDIMSGIRDFFSESYFYEAEENDKRYAYFKNGNALFLIDTLSAVKEICDMPYEWGVLPVPKVAQGSGDTPMTKHTGVICYPDSSNDSNEIAYILVALNLTANRLIHKATVYDYLHNYVRCAENIEMIELITKKTVTDFSLFYADEYGNYKSGTLDAFYRAVTENRKYSTLWFNSRWGARKSLSLIK